MAPRNFDDDRDRTVPPEEDYYGRAPIDLNFNSRENSRQNEGGINPAEEYEKYCRENLQKQNGETHPINNSSYSASNKNQQADKYLRDDLRYSPPTKKTEPAKQKDDKRNKKKKVKTNHQLGKRRVLL